MSPEPEQHSIVIETGPTKGWYNERCHRAAPGNANRWRCQGAVGCGLLHFYCVHCSQFKTIPDAWEKTSVWTLNKRMTFIFPEFQVRFRLKQSGWICDPCWFAIREQVRAAPKRETKVYVGA